LEAALKRSGFTLLEGLVVLAVLGVLLALATPSYLRWRAHTVTNEAALQFARDIERTRTEAKRLNTRMRIELASDNGYRRINVASGATTSISLPPGVRLEPGDTLDSQGHQRSTWYIVFVPPYGTTDASPASFRVSWSNDTSIERTVRVVGVTGKVIVR
jgi:prepilin-type N-terminal cleavage/methylation domain-containing protein